MRTHTALTLVLILSFCGAHAPRSASAQATPTLQLHASGTPAETGASAPEPTATTAAAAPEPEAVPAAAPAALAATTGAVNASAPAAAAAPEGPAGATCRSYTAVNTAPAAASSVTSVITLPATLPAPQSVAVSGIRLTHPNPQALRITLAHAPPANATNATAPAAANATLATAVVKDIRAPLPAATADPTPVTGFADVPAGGPWVLVINDLGSAAASRTIDLAAWTLQLCFDSAELAATEPAPPVTASAGPDAGTDGAGVIGGGLLGGRRDPILSTGTGAGIGAGVADGPILGMLRNATDGLGLGAGVGALRRNSSADQEAESDRVVIGLLSRLSDDLQPPANGTGAAGWRLDNITLPEGPVQRLLDALLELVNTTDTADALTATAARAGAGATPTLRSGLGAALNRTAGGNGSETTGTPTFEATARPSRMAQSALDFLDSSGPGGSAVAGVLRATPRFRDGALSTFSKPLRVRAQDGATTALSLASNGADFLHSGAQSLLNNVADRAGSWRSNLASYTDNAVAAAQRATDTFTSSLASRGGAIGAMAQQMQVTAQDGLTALKGQRGAAATRASAALSKIVASATPLRTAAATLVSDAGSAASNALSAYRDGMSRVNDLSSAAINAVVGRASRSSSLSLDVVAAAVSRVNDAVTKAEARSGPLASRGLSAYSKGLDTYKSALGQLKTAINAVPPVDLNKLYDRFGLQGTMSRSTLSDLAGAAGASAGGGRLSSLMSGIGAAQGLTGAVAAAPKKLMMRRS